MTTFRPENLPAAPDVRGGTFPGATGPDHIGLNARPFASSALPSAPEACLRLRLRLRLRSTARWSLRGGVSPGFAAGRETKTAVPRWRAQKKYGRRQQERKQSASRHGAAGRTTRRRRASSGVRRGFRAPVPGSPELKRGRPRAGPDSIAGLGRPPRASLGRGRASFGSRPRGHASRPCRPTRRPRDA